MQEQAAWTSFKHVLCVRLDNMGDVLMTSPAIRALKEDVPGRKITLLASPAGAAIARYIPGIDEIIEFPVPWEGQHPNSTAGTTEKMVETLRQHCFDAAVIFNVYSQNPLPAALLCYLAGIPNISGYCRENPYHLMNCWIPDKEPLYEIKHEVNRQLDLVRALQVRVRNTSLVLDIPPSAHKSLMKKLRQQGVDPDEPYLLLHAGVSEKKREYPVEAWAAAAKKITEETGYPILLTGLASEQRLADPILKTGSTKIFSLLGMLALDELIAAIQQAVLLLTTNSGPAHMAAAVNTPVVVLYALTNPQHAPWQVKHRILPFDVQPEMRSKNILIACAREKTFSRTAEMVVPEQVVLAVKDVLAGRNVVEKTELVTV